MIFHSVQVLDLRHNGAVLTLVSCQERGTIEFLLECVGRAYRSNLEFTIDITYKRSRGSHNSSA
jgi:hypothetical protein